MSDTSTNEPTRKYSAHDWVRTTAKVETDHTPAARRRILPIGTEGRVIHSRALKEGVRYKVGFGESGFARVSEDQIEPIIVCITRPNGAVAVGVIAGDAAKDGRVPVKFSNGVTEWFNRSELTPGVLEDLDDGKSNIVAFPKSEKPSETPTTPEIATKPPQAAPTPPEPTTDAGTPVLAPSEGDEADGQLVSLFRAGDEVIYVADTPHTITKTASIVKGDRGSVVTPGLGTVTVRFRLPLLGPRVIVVAEHSIELVQPTPTPEQPTKLETAQMVGVFRVDDEVQAVNDIAVIGDTVKKGERGIVKRVHVGPVAVQFQYRGLRTINENEIELVNPAGTPGPLGELDAARKEAEALRLQVANLQSEYNKLKAAHERLADESLKLAQIAQDAQREHDEVKAENAVIRKQHELTVAQFQRDIEALNKELDAAPVAVKSAEPLQIGYEIKTLEQEVKAGHTQDWARADEELQRYENGGWGMAHITVNTVYSTIDKLPKTYHHRIVTFRRIVEIKPAPNGESLGESLKAEIGNGHVETTSIPVTSKSMIVSVAELPTVTIVPEGELVSIHDSYSAILRGNLTNPFSSGIKRIPQNK